MARGAEFAWPEGDRPGNLVFAHQPAENIQIAVRQALSSAFPPALDVGASLTALRPSYGPAGRYQLTTRDGKWFVRVSSRWGRPDLEQALARFLLSEGVSVSPIIVAGVPLQWHGDRFRIDVRPMIEGRHFDGSLADLQSAAAILSTCHKALRRFPRHEAVRTAAAARNDRLREIRDRVAACLSTGKFNEFDEYAEWASAHRQWLEEMKNGFDPHVERWPGAQCLHGEVHRGNVLFRVQDGSPVLVDLEEAVHVFAPPAWDVAFLIQRFGLADSPSRAVLKKRFAAISVGYAVPLPDVALMMRQIAWFNMAVILELRRTEGVVTPLSEYNKFVALERQAINYHGA
jgi:hypothetical protein